MNAFENCGFVKQFRSDPHRYEHCLSSSKPEKKFRPLRNLNL